MRKTALVSLLLLLSGQAMSHPAPFDHPEIAASNLHSLMHFAFLLPLGLGVFLLSRWLVRRNQH